MFPSESMYLQIITKQGYINATGSLISHLFKDCEVTEIFQELSCMLESACTAKFTRWGVKIQELSHMLEHACTAKFTK